MDDEVNSEMDGRMARRLLTERKILDAARAIFVSEGYAAATFPKVAERAGVAVRTVFVHFPTKADLLKRVIDVAVVGDQEPVDLISREGFQAGMTAPTLAERLTHFAAIAAQIQSRMSDVVAVAAGVIADEPVIAELADAGRRGTVAHCRQFWAALRDDGLLPESVDARWAADTCSVLIQPDTFNVIRASLDWDLREYERWLLRTISHLAGAPTA